MKRHEMRRLVQAQSNDPGIIVPGTGGGHGAADVKHMCPECGGPTALLHDAAGIVGMCWACHGKGTLTDDELTGYQARLNARAAGGLL